MAIPLPFTSASWLTRLLALGLPPSLPSFWMVCWLPGLLAAALFAVLLVRARHGMG
jgi:hypothetical protein